MTFALQALVQLAATELGSDACRDGRHAWESEGGRSCPKEFEVCCSQAVYRCRTCGTYDYGEFGGPGHADCQRCQFKHLEICQQCGGAGEIFMHAEDCIDDLCALNGDEHSCSGVLVPCICKESGRG